MARKPRIHYEGALYHVITRGNNRQKIFNSKEDYETLINYLKELKERKPFKIFAYCLMPNHIHLLIEVKKDSLSVIMQRLLTRYTKYSNLKNRKWGHLFQGRYKAILCEKDSYLLELVRYIHLNPVRGKLVKKPVEWEWSTHRQYLGYKQDGFAENVEMLKYFSNDKRKAKNLYEEFIREGINEGHRNDMYPQESIPYLGEDNFIAEHMILHNDIIEKQTPGVSMVKTDLNDILNNVSKETGISLEVIKGNARQSEVAKSRREFVLQAYKSGHKPADIARLLNRSISFACKLINKEN